MLDNLERVLATLYDTSAKARLVIDRAGISAERIDLNGAMREVWHGIVNEAVRSGRLTDLVRIALEDYSDRTELRRFQEALESVAGTASNEDAMSDRWGTFGDVARLGERISVLETRLPLIEQGMGRRFDELQAGQNNNRVYSEKEFGEMRKELGELRTLIKATPVKPADDRQFVATIVIGALVTAILILVIAYWVYVLTGGRLT